MTEVTSDMQDGLQYLESADSVIRKSLIWIKQQCIGDSPDSSVNRNA